METTTLIENAIRFIQQNPQENLSLQSIAENAGFSLTYFDALFQKYTGYSPVEYARKYKLTRSALQLRTTRKTVLDIALEFGYESPESFARAFKAYYGLSPSDYRAQNEQEAVTWKELSGKISVAFFKRNFPQLRSCDREKALDYCFSNDLRFHAENIGFILNGDAEVFTLDERESPEHFLCAADYNRAEPIVYIIAGREADAMAYLQLLSGSENMNFTVRVPVSENWTMLENEIERMNLEVHYGYDMLVPDKTVEVPEIEGMSVRELRTADLPLVWAFKKTPGGEACPAAALQLAFTGKGNPGMRGFGLFVDGELVGISMPAPDFMRGICKYDIGWIGGIGAGSSLQAMELLWKHSAAVCLREAAMFGNGDAEENDSLLGISFSQRMGMEKIAKVLRCRRSCQ